jgi:hypothetical protein
MLRKLIGSIRVFCILLVVVVATALGQTEQSRSHLQPEHRKVLKRWLEAGKLNLRPATYSDCDDLGGLSQTQAEMGSEYYPYYTAGDFNTDRNDDFAIALVDPTKEKDRFSIAIFHGGKRANAAPAFFEPGWDLSKRGLFDAVGLIVKSFGDEDDCVILLWDGKRYILRNCVTPPGEKRDR